MRTRLKDGGTLDDVAGDCRAGAIPTGFRLGAWWVDPASGELSRPGVQRRLPPQPMDLLAYLAANPGRLVTKEELLSAIWQGAAVEEIALPRCVSEIRKALGDDAKDPKYIETIPKRGYRLVAASGEVGSEGGEEPVAARRAFRPPRRVAVAAVALSAVAFAGAAALIWLETRTGTASTGAEHDGGRAASLPSVAVLGFANRSGTEELAWLETALPELLAGELALAEEVRVIPAELVAPLVDELSLASGAELDDDARRRVGRALGAGLLITGSFASASGVEGEGLRIEAVVHGESEREPIAALAAEGSALQATEVAALLGARLRERLGAGASQAANHEAPAAVLPRSPGALRLYYDGLRRLRRFEALAARALLERSLVEEPEQPLVLLALSQAWTALGNRARATELAHQAVALSSAFPREQRLRIEAQYLTASGRRDAAVELYRGLWQRSPENLEVGIYLARAQLEAQLSQEALATVAKIHSRAGESYSDPRLDLLEASAERALGNYERALVAARRAVRLGAEIGAEQIVAHGRSIEGFVLHVMGRVQEARVAQEAAALAFAAVGDRRQEAWARLRLAAWLQDAGDFSSAQEICREALAALRECGDAAGEAQAQIQLAALARERGDFEQAEALGGAALEITREIGERGREAEALTHLGINWAIQEQYAQAAVRFEEALVIRREAGNPALVATSLSNLGKLYLLQGHFALAAVKLREAEALSRELKLPDLLATVQFNLGYLHSEAGELTAAEAAFSEAEARFRKLENRRMAASSLQALGEVHLMRGDLEGARERLEAALADRVAMGDQIRIAESRKALVELLIEEGDVRGAGRMAEEAMVAAQSAGDPAVVTTKLARALLAEGKVRAALEVVESLGIPPPRSPIPVNELSQRTVAASVWAAAGKIARAKTELGELVREAEKLGAWRAAAEASLALAEVELHEGPEPAALERLSKLEADARARGFHLLAGKARVAASSSPPARLARSSQPR